MLVFLASLLALVSILVVFARNEILDTDTYIATVGPLASDPAIQSAVAGAVSRQLVEKVDVQNRVSNALPEKAGFLAAPITSSLESLTHQVALKFVQSSAFEKLWVSANRAAHKQVVSLLTGDQSGALTADRGKVSLDLGNVQAKVKQALDKQGITVFDKVPTANGTSFVLFESDQLVKAQRWIRALNRLAYLLPILSVICYAGAILLSANRRRGLVRAAIGLAVAMALLLVGVALGRHQYLSALRSSIPRAAAANAYDAVTAFPLGTTRVVLLVAVIVALAGIAVGNERLRSWARSVNKPRWFADSVVHRWIRAHRRPLQWLTIAVGFVVLIVWDNPTPRVAVITLIVALAVVVLIGTLARQRVVLVVAPGGSGGRSPSETGANTDTGTGTDTRTGTDTGTGTGTRTGTERF